MRKFKTMLLSAGIAAVLALGGAVGAHLATNDAPLRTEAAAKEPCKSAVFTSTSFDKGGGGYDKSFSSTTNGFTVDIVNANNNDRGWDLIKIGDKNGARRSSITTANAITEKISDVTLHIDSGSKGLNKVDFISLYYGKALSSLTKVANFEIAAGAQTVHIDNAAENYFYKIDISTQKGSANGLLALTGVDFYEYVEVDPNAFAISASSEELSFAHTEKAAKTVTVTPKNAAGEVAYSVVPGYDTAIISVTNQDNVFSFTPGSKLGTTTVTLKANDTAADATIDIQVTVAQIYTKVSDLATLKYGDVVIIGTNENTFGALNKGGYYAKLEMTVNENVASVLGKATSFVVEPGSVKDSKTFKNIETNKYMSAESNKLVEVQQKNASSDWTVEKKGENIEIKNVATTEKNNSIISWHKYDHHFNLYNNCNQISLYKAEGNSYLDELSTWVDNNMEMKNPEFEGNGTGACRAIYWNVKSKLVNLDKKNDGTMELFQNESQFEAAKLRYTKWATANGDATPFGNNLKPSNISIFDNNNNVSLIVIISVSVLAISGIAIFAITRRKKLAK